MNTGMEMDWQKLLDKFRQYAAEAPAPAAAGEASTGSGKAAAACEASLLAECGVELGISLPLSTRGFYEVFSDYAEKHHPIVAFSDFWELRVDGQAIQCSAQSAWANASAMGESPP